MVHISVETRKTVSAFADSSWFLPNTGVLFSTWRKRKRGWNAASRNCSAINGVLITYGPDLPDLYYRVGGYADKILKGDKPSDLPVEQPTKFQLVINMKTAKALGLSVPPSLLFRADEVIE